MRFDHYHHWPDLDRFEKKLDKIINMLTGLKRQLTVQGENIMLDLSVLEAQVKANTDAEAAAITVIQSLADEIAANAGDAAKVADFASRLKSSADALGAAIVANTPTQP